MRKKRVILWVGGAVAAIVGLAFGYYCVILDWSDRPFCHKQVMLSFLQWMGDQGMDFNSHTNAFPNVQGDGMESLATIREYMGGHMEWAEDYRYVPGLREDDPGDLVLMYFDRATRWTWHGPPPTIFEERAWIIVPVDFSMGVRPLSGPGELSERVTKEEFRRRLSNTLDFIRTNERPYWQTVVAEHAGFSDPIEDVSQ